MKSLFFCFISFLLVSCATSGTNNATHYPEIKYETVRVTGNSYSTVYPIHYKYYPHELTNVLKKSAQLTIDSGYVFFIIFEDETNLQGLKIITFMFNEVDELPDDLKSLEIFDAEEALDDNSYPLGIVPNAA